MELWLERFARAAFERSADTAHDLKTPLNVAVLNLELLRMRLRKLEADGDLKVEAATRAIEIELRRLSQIFDAFFLLSTPPRSEGAPGVIDLAPLCESGASAWGFTVSGGGPAEAAAHEPRIRQAFQLFFEGASKLFPERHAEAAVDGERFTVTVTGHTASEEETALARIFKFYYTDGDGNPDLSLAVARLITETYGGEVTAAQDRDKVVLRLSVPLGAR